MVSTGVGYSMDLTQVLENTVSTDANRRTEAQTFLEQAAVNNFPEFLKSLSDVLVNISKPDLSRAAAGLQLKNALVAKDADLRQQYQARWLSVPHEVRNYIKGNVVSTLGTEKTRPSTAAQCVASIAVAELPHNLWPDVVTVLTRNVTDSSSTELKKEATLEAIGYICQDIEPEILENQSNTILTAIVHGMRKEEENVLVKFAATTALLNSLEFTRANFEKESERHFIMEVVCSATLSNDKRVKVAALQCLVRIMSLYYVYMEDYMGPALFAITVNAMKSDDSDVALQGIEFWSNVCDEEVDLAMEAQEAAEQGIPPSKTSRFYAKGALQYLVPILTETLCKQDENDDEDDWNPCKAAGVCLMLLANCCEDDITQYVVPFVEANITHQEWNRRDAAIMAFGSMLEGPDQSVLKPIVENAFPMLISLMKDPNVAVRDSTAWTIGRICELIPEAVLNQTYLHPLLETLLNSLTSEPRVAANVCWAFNSLAEAAFENADRDDDSEPKTYVLSPFFELIVAKLLETTERPDANVANLRSAAYEALMELIKNSPKDCYICVQRTTITILHRIQQILQLEGHVQSHDRAQYNDLASLLCATLQSVLRKVTPQDVPQISDTVMSALVAMMTTQRTSGVQEDALMAVGVLIEVLGDGFMKYMEAFKPYLLAGLQNHAEYQVCSAAVGLVADISRSLGKKILPFCDEIMRLLLENLSNNNVHRSVKPQILSVFGDVALAIGPEFKKYLSIVLNTLMQASQLPMVPNDYDLIDYVNEIRENCLEAYTGIVQGLKGDSKEQPNADVLLLEPHLNYMGQFIITVAEDADVTDSLIAASAGLIGDLISVFGLKIVPLVERDVVSNILARGRKSKQPKTRTLCTWAIKESRRLRQTSSPNSSSWIPGAPDTTVASAQS